MIEKVTNENVEAWLDLASVLWSSNKDDLKTEYQEGNFQHEFLYSKNGVYVAFMSLSIRQDYVEGSTTSPVAYLEGIYVVPDYQEQGIAREMLDYARSWARSHQLKQLASDCDIANILSQTVHKKLGFDEVSQTIHFMMNLE